MNCRRYISGIIIIIGLLVSLNSLWSQDIVTADEYFEKVSKTYGEIKDYEAKIKITQAKGNMEGDIFYRTPNLLRINFKSPEGQYMIVNDEALTIYIPEYSVLLKQALPKRSNASLESMASSQGLTYLRNNYRIAFLVGPNPVPLDENSPEKVVKLKFQWRATAEGFRDIEIDFSEKGLIRRIIGITATGINIQFDFSQIRINQGLPKEYFNVAEPASAYEYKNFLFGDEE